VLAQAILLGGLALKRRWQEKRKAEGKTTAVTPNIVCSSAVHVSTFILPVASMLWICPFLLTFLITEMPATFLFQSLSCGRVLMMHPSGL
jgi:hypothetical protein